MSALEFESTSEERTVAIGSAIGRVLGPGDVVALAGELGTGKTRLAKGLAAGLGVADDRVVNSPTFVLINQYAGRCPVYHLDLYRLPPGADLGPLGFEECCDGRAVVIVEWADRSAAAMADNALWIRMTATGETTRHFAVTADAPTAERIRTALAEIVDIAAL